MLPQSKPSLFMRKYNPVEGSNEGLANPERAFLSLIQVINYTGRAASPALAKSVIFYLVFAFLPYIPFLFTYHQKEGLEFF